MARTNGECTTDVAMQIYLTLRRLNSKHLAVEANFESSQLSVMVVTEIVCKPGKGV